MDTQKPKSLADKAILAKLSISRYAARIQDKESRNVISKKFGSDIEATLVSKRLLDPRDPIVAQVSRTINAIKAYHRTNTVPWDYDGTGVLRSTKYPNYAQNMRQLFDEYFEAVKKYVKAFLSLKKNAETFLGNLYNEDDYPSEYELDQKFKIDLEILPIPQAGDFRVDLPMEAMEEIEKNLVDAENKKMKEAMAKLFRRLYDPVKHMVEELTKEKSRIHQSLIGNIEKIIEILPDLNLLEDSALEDLRKEVEEKLCQIPIEEIRESDFVKSETRRAAKKLANKIKDVSEIEDDDEILKMMDSSYGSKVIGKVGKPVYGQTKIGIKNG